MESLNLTQGKADQLQAVHRQYNILNSKLLGSLRVAQGMKSDVERQELLLPREIQELYSQVQDSAMYYASKQSALISDLRAAQKALQKPKTIRPSSLYRRPDSRYIDLST
jgi:hypothetical protein